MWLYIKCFDKFDSSKLKKRDFGGKKMCYLHISVLEDAIKWATELGYEVLGWEAIIFTPKWTLSPVELIIWTWPEIDRESRNNNALKRDYVYFLDIIKNRTWNGEYRMENVFVDLSIQ